MTFSRLKSLKPVIQFIRCINTNEKIVPRVRFAPSPTGYLHLGGLRTALYNYLYTKSRGGIFILRIEDTDQTRIVEDSVKALIKDLKWAGINYDEGPGKGENRISYVQSERKDIYHKHITQLLQDGSAYKCFCSERRLTMLRRDAVRSQTIPRYDNRCRDLDKKDMEKKLENGTPYCIRFKLSSDCSSFNDLIYGRIEYDITQNEGDPVLMKSDGYPTYHFANVVDDHLMEITHVLRGVEWQISTTKHLLLYKAFGWTPPIFGHLPLIVNSDGTKLSKRQSDIRVEDYRHKGVFPLALVNFITLAGGGFEHVTGAGIKLRSMEELANEFQLEKVSSHPSRLNTDLLEDCNRLELKRYMQNESLSVRLVEDLRIELKTKYPKEKLNLTDEYIKSILEWSTSRISRLDELTSDKFAFLWILPSEAAEDLDKDLVVKLVQRLEGLESFEKKYLIQVLRNFSKENNVKFAVMMKMLRSLISGLEEGPSVADMMELLGKERSLERLKTAVR